MGTPRKCLNMVRLSVVNCGPMRSDPNPKHDNKNPCFYNL